MQFLCGIWIVWCEKTGKGENGEGEIFSMLLLFFARAVAYKSILSDAFFMYTSETCSEEKTDSVAQASNMNSHICVLAICDVSQRVLF